MKEENLLKLTVAEYLLSDDRAINQKGVEPRIRLFPVSASRLGSLANVPAGAVPYVRGAGEDDAFPVEVGAILLRDPGERGLASVRAQAYENIAKHLEPLGVRWSERRGADDATLPLPLGIAVQAPTLVSGETGTVRITVSNPNDFALPDVWLSLDAGALYLDNKIAGLGELAARGSVTTEIELLPPDGISVEHHPIDLLVGVPELPQRTRDRLVDDEHRAAADELLRLGEREVGLDAGGVAVHHEADGVVAHEAVGHVGHIRRDRDVVGQLLLAEHGRSDPIEEEPEQATQLLVAGGGVELLGQPAGHRTVAYADRRGRRHRGGRHHAAGRRHASGRTRTTGRA